ncbi:MAG: hypothetical protein KJ015_09945 [Myxococcales bacterium]|nr:hypothetical protein [Myxococcales bacterium]
MDAQQIIPALDGEDVLAVWRDVSLTAQRVYRLKRTGPHINWISLAIEEVEWVSLEREHHPVLLLFAALNAIAWPTYMFIEWTNRGPWPADMEWTSYAMVAVGLGLALPFSVVMVALYLITRRLRVTIGAGVGKIQLRAPPLDAGLKEAARFLCAVQAQASRARGWPRR